jgi:hypothetical protein
MDRGYYRISLSKYGKKKTFRVHQLVAMAFLGHTPDGTTKIVVDHIDSNGLNNHKDNLQLITNRENLSKERSLKKGIPTGVSFDKSLNKYVAKIGLNGRSKHLGYFEDQNEALLVYKQALKMINDGDLSFFTFKEPTSKYLGVCWCKIKKKWRVTVLINKKQFHIGFFTNETEAYNARIEVDKMIKCNDFSFKNKNKSSSQYKGVFWDKSRNRWRSIKTINGIKKYGSFKTEIEAFNFINTI